MPTNNATTRTGCSVEITGLVDVDWVGSSDAPNGLGRKGVYVRRIQFNPSGTNDILIITNGVGGSPKAKFYATNGRAPMEVYLNEEESINPAIDISNCSIGTPANASVMIELVPGT